uniref:C-type lectin domain-containing protein n=1 Tax=Electrophorus electricus TaxID=8005 RepID=A0AAY5EIY8_ELEEL
FLLYQKHLKFLVLIADYKNWTEAQRYCREHHTDLASIKNQDENSRIASLVGQNFVWIGLHRTRTWSDQSNSSFRYWKTEHVNSRLEDLIRLLGFFMKRAQKCRSPEAILIFLA